MTLPRRFTVLAAKVEATPGTAEALTASEAAYNIFDAQITPNIPMSERPQQGSYRHNAAVAGPRSATCTFRIELTGNGSGGVPTWATVFLAACGVVNSGGVLTPRNEVVGANVKTITIGVYEAGRRSRMSGAMGNAVFEFVSGQLIGIDFTFTGKWEGEDDQTLIVPTYPTRLPLRAAATTFTIGSVTPCFETMTFDLGNEVYLRPCSTTDSGFAAAVITSRRPVFSLDPEAKLVATDDRYGRWLASTTQAFSYAVEDADDSITFAAPAVQIMNVTPGERGNLITDNTELLCVASGTDPEFSITFAAA
jgi:hypothetical protein